MDDSTQPALSVLVATRNRATLLARLFESLDTALAAAGADIETLIIDNGSTDETPRLIETWIAAGPGRARLLIDQPGQSHALNCGIGVARGPLLAFIDDDVQVEASWARAVLAFFARHPHYDAGMGRVRIPPEVTDPQVIQQVLCYETLPLFDRGDLVRDLTTIYGCNMVLRRQVVERVGVFDARLGPGTSGFGGDTDLCERIVAAGLRIGYMPEAVVYHAVEVERLTPEFFRDYHRRKARGDFQWAPGRFGRKNLSRLVDASLRWVWCSLTGDAQRRMRARMRMIRNAEFLRLRWQAARQRRP